jgi:hypothetical protein
MPYKIIEVGKRAFDWAIRFSEQINFSNKSEMQIANNFGISS